MKKPTRIIVLSILSVLCVLFSTARFYSNAETNIPEIDTVDTNIITAPATEPAITKAAAAQAALKAETTKTTISKAIIPNAAAAKTAMTKAATIKPTTKAPTSKTPVAKVTTTKAVTTKVTATAPAKAAVPAVSYNGLFLWPVPASKTFNSCYGDGRRHDGLDIKSSTGGSIGDSVIAVYKGTVDYISSTCNHNYPKTSTSFCGCGHGLGNYIRIKHVVNGTVYYTYYGHLSKINVSKGAAVSKGQVIGHIGSTGNSYGYHLHFIIANSGRTPLDPFFGVTAYNAATTPLSTGKKFLLTIPRGLTCSAVGTKDTCCKRYRERIQYIYGITVPQL